MKRIFSTLMVLVFLGLMLNTAPAEQDLLQSVAEGCKAEIDTYCAKVTPGQGRILACLYAHGDKLSAKCEYALYDAAVQLERAVAALSYVASECDADLEKLCSSVQAGEGRLLQCLEKNEKQVSGRCKEALKEVGLK
ncbi:MAG: cysteine rich repeat-containing protein [Desulfobacterales bacterium]